ncbi:MAG: hypothetical protein LBD21_05490 [Tannerellaceae bacterium]|jgi:hypothetical protein|nr:hypothetical protein [Tannerellaceae bacterium]
MKYIILILLCLSFCSCKKEPLPVQNPDYEQNDELTEGNPDPEEKPEEEPGEADEPPTFFLPDGEHIFNHDITACGVKDPIANFPWLADLIEAAEKDTTLYHAGRIYLEQYKGQDLFVICWFADSRGRWFVDCLGNDFVTDDYSEFIAASLKMKYDVIVYANTAF